MYVDAGVTLCWLFGRLLADHKTTSFPADGHSSLSLPSLFHIHGNAQGSSNRQEQKSEASPKA